MADASLMTAGAGGELSVGHPLVGRRKSAGSFFYGAGSGYFHQGQNAFKAAPFYHPQIIKDFK